jgi:hypothetical protein
VHFKHLLKLTLHFFVKSAFCRFRLFVAPRDFTHIFSFLRQIICFSFLLPERCLRRTFLPQEFLRIFKQYKKTFTMPDREGSFARRKSLL